MSSFQSTSFFSLPLRPWQQPLSVRAAKYDPRKRRRKNEDVLNSGEEEEKGGDASDTSGSASDKDDREDVNDESSRSARGSGRPMSAAASPILLSPDEAHQYRIAGHPQDEDLPGGHFPHSAP